MNLEEQQEETRTREADILNFALVMQLFLTIFTLLTPLISRVK